MVTDFMLPKRDGFMATIEPCCLARNWEISDVPSIDDHENRAARLFVTAERTVGVHIEKLAGPMISTADA
jgi:hypothetical protein